MILRPLALIDRAAVLGVGEDVVGRADVEGPEAAQDIQDLWDHCDRAPTARRLGRALRPEVAGAGNRGGASAQGDGFRGALAGMKQREDKGVVESSMLEEPRDDGVTFVVSEGIGQGRELNAGPLHRAERVGGDE